jgi:hypothetical protein
MRPLKPEVVLKKLLGTLLSVLVGIAAFALVQVVVREAVSGSAGQQRQETRSIETMIKSSPAEPMYTALMSYFPEDAKLFRDSFEAVLNNRGSDEEAFSKMMSVGAEIRRRHAPSLRAAPDASLTAVIQAQLQLLKQFESDPFLCNQVFAYGPVAAPKDQQAKLAETAKLSATILFRAMHEGKVFPVQRSAATEEDWNNLVQEFYSLGGTEEQLSLVSDPDLQNSALCGAGLLFLRAAAFATFDGADRIRAELAHAMNEG